jgi:hypothetical protein
MPMGYNLSWQIGAPNERQGRLSGTIPWPDIEKILNDTMADCGVVDLSDIAATPDETKRLQLRADGGNFLLALGEVIAGEHEVRSYFGTGTGSIEILGDLWDCRMISGDPWLVLDTFREFLETGNVSKGILH